MGSSHATDASHADTAHGGSHELPPVPSVRHITPAWADFQNMPAPTALLWPVFWLLVGVALWVLIA